MFALLSYFFVQSPRRFVFVSLVPSVVVCQVCGFVCPFRSDDWACAALHLPSDADKWFELLQKIFFLQNKLDFGSHGRPRAGVAVRSVSHFMRFL